MLVISRCFVYPRAVPYGAWLERLSAAALHNKPKRPMCRMQFMLLSVPKRAAFHGQMRLLLPGWYLPGVRGDIRGQ